MTLDLKERLTRPRTPSSTAADPGAGANRLTLAPKEVRRAAQEEPVKEADRVRKPKFVVVAPVQKRYVRGIVLGPVAARKARGLPQEEKPQKADRVREANLPVLVTVSRYLTRACHAHRLGA